MITKVLYAFLLPPFFFKIENDPGKCNVFLKNGMFYRKIMGFSQHEKYIPPEKGHFLITVNTQNSFKKNGVSWKGHPALDHLELRIK
jgi:hypothetical protein